MEFATITALVPIGEYFDSKAVGEGVWLSESHLVAIEKALINANNAGETLSAANARITALEELSGTQSKAVSDAATALAEAEETITTHQARITELEAQVTELGKQPSGSGTTLTISEDDHTGKKGKPSWFVEDGSSILAETYVK